ncbi:hypothetical protein ICG_05842 [Bacillus cereus BAG1X1-3]|nr:hypothetical protein ICG_05842 [Bacillus cereus BAG1X1-3]EOO74072.1 hypothetical protein IC7_05736 [Bacillus cereus BAG1O-1]
MSLKTIQSVEIDTNKIEVAVKMVLVQSFHLFGMAA